MYLSGIYVQQLPIDGKWHVCQAANMYPPAGRISATGYETQAEALVAAKRGDFR